MNVYKVGEISAQRKTSTADYLEFFRQTSISAGVYLLPKDSVDPQQPHTEDELYYIVSGHGQFTCGGDKAEVGPGDALYVAKGVDHRFHDITEDMTILVVFAPPEGANKR